MDPERIPRWWGPHGSTTTVVEMDVRVGGKWRYISHAPDRDDVPFMGEYLEIEPPERFKWTFIVRPRRASASRGAPRPSRSRRSTGRRRSRRRSHFPSIEGLEDALATGMIAGGVETWDRFAAMLAEG